jgi:hypothetical protein
MNWSTGRFANITYGLKRVQVARFVFACRFGTEQNMAHFGGRYGSSDLVVSDGLAPRLRRRGTGIQGSHDPDADG